MRRFVLGRLRFRVHPAAGLALALTALRGGPALAAALAASVAFHEACHALAALALRVKVLEIELMPFGGAVRLEDAWRLRPGQLGLVALAGPAGSALLLALSVHLLPCPPLALANALLLAMNLLPALPLDGGRLLSGLLSLAIGPRRAARTGVFLGGVLAACLLALALWGLFHTGRLNPSLPLCGAFLLAAGPRELLAATGGALLSLMDRRTELEAEGALPVKWLAAGTDTAVRSVLARLTPRVVCRVAVYDRDMRLRGVLEEDHLFQAALQDGERPLSALLTSAAPQARRVTVT